MTFAKKFINEDIINMEGT